MTTVDRDQVKRMIDEDTAMLIDFGGPEGRRTINSTKVRRS